MSDQSLLNGAAEPWPGQLGFCTGSTADCTAIRAGVHAFFGTGMGNFWRGRLLGLPFPNMNRARLLAECHFDRLRRGSIARSTTGPNLTGGMMFMRIPSVVVLGISRGRQVWRAVAGGTAANHASGPAEFVALETSAAVGTLQRVDP